VREKAQQHLIDAREGALSALTKASKNPVDLEISLRIRQIQARLKPQAPARLREARAVMVLEARATLAARRLLQNLASGLSEARLTQEAKGALKRMEVASSLKGD
jgi:hypothetical protein